MSQPSGSGLRRLPSSSQPRKPEPEMDNEDTEKDLSTPTIRQTPQRASKTIAQKHIFKQVEMDNEYAPKKTPSATRHRKEERKKPSPAKRHKMEEEEEEPSGNLTRSAIHSTPVKSTSKSPGRGTRGASKSRGGPVLDTRLTPGTQAANALAEFTIKSPAPKAKEASKSKPGPSKRLLFKNESDDEQSVTMEVDDGFASSLKTGIATTKASPQKVDDPHVEDEESDEEAEEHEDEEQLEKRQASSAFNLTAFRRCLETLDEKIPKNIQKELQKVEEHLFPEWTDYLFTGDFNILVHGTGSKYDLLQSYVQKELHEPDISYATFKGYAKQINAKFILEVIEKNYIDKQTAKCSARDLLGRARRVVEAVERKDDDFFIVIHNIDGPGLRDPKQQEVLAELAKSKLIHFVASVDHINANLLWDEKGRAAFKWLAMHIPTFRCYKRELLAGESRLIGLDSKHSGRAHTIETLQAVWHSMPVNSRRLLRKLVEMICEGTERVTFTSFLRVARNEFMTQSEVTLRMQIRELEDHHIIKHASEGIKLEVNQDVIISFLDAADDHTSD